DGGRAPDAGRPGRRGQAVGRRRGRPQKGRRGAESGEEITGARPGWPSPGKPSRDPPSWPTAEGPFLRPGLTCRWGAGALKRDSRPVPLPWPMLPREAVMRSLCRLALGWLGASLLVFLGPVRIPAADPGYDLLIRNAKIVDGTGNPWFTGDLAVRGDRIVAVGRVPRQPAKREIDAKGL